MSGKALVTGSAGFIGYFVAKRLLENGWHVVGVDSMNTYYEVALKRRRHAMLRKFPNFTAIESSIEQKGFLRQLFGGERFDLVVHLAAQAGVRHSIDAPEEYLDANLAGTYELLEAARSVPPQHILFASSSSVYGANEKVPYRETDKVDHQISFYAATKKAGETMTHTYAHLYYLPVTCFRFFTVYGPWGRPDMAHFKFTRLILRDEPIKVYNHGDMKRDFTFIDDLVDSIVALADIAPQGPKDRGAAIDGDSLSPVAPHRIVNIGNGAPVQLLDFIAAIEEACGVKAEKIMQPMQPGDVPATWADTALLKRLTGKQGHTDLREGIRQFVDWYREYYGV